MKKFSLLLVIIILTSAFVFNTDAQERKKLAQAGMKFLSVSLDPRSSAMGDAVTALLGNSTSMLYNPSAMGEMQGMTDFAFGTTRWIADINYIYGTAALNLFDGDYGVFGVSLVAVDYGEFQGTIIAPNDDGYLDVGTFKPTALSFGIGYSKQLSEKFMVGGNVKYVRQSMGTAIVGFDPAGSRLTEDYTVDVAAFDFGILYHTGFKSLNFGMSIRNFSAEISYKDENFQLPLTFRIGVSMDAMDLTNVDTDLHSLLVAVDASHPRDYPEQVSLGLEYTFMKTFALRGGYTFPSDEQEYTVGVGFRQKLSDFKFAVDYSYTPFGVFADVHRVSINIGY